MESYAKTTFRTDYCGEARITDCGTPMTVCGWVQRQRDLGQLIFIDLRDRTGIIQLAFDDHTDRALFDLAASCRSEFVLQAAGTVRERSAKNTEILTGEVELEVTALKILGRSETPPFEISDSCTANENLRLKYRYLDLRRPELQKNLIFRHKVAKITRDYFDENGFIEIETPTLIKSTPEGARDFLVPSRLHKGHFYALPQSPQLYKQLTMVAGFDRYMQIARCYRDEDLRADRQPEFTQIDLEMSFVDMEDILNVGEGYIRRVFHDAMGIDIGEVPRLTYMEAMNRYGSDKPDTRYAMEITDLTDIVRNCGFGVFKGAVEGGGSVRAICAKNAVKQLSRKEIDKLVEFVKGIGGKGIAWIRLNEDGMASSFAKFMAEEEMEAILDRCGAETGDVVLIVADVKNSAVLTQLGQLRITVAKKLDIIPKDKFNLLWIIEFPFFDWDEDANEWVAMHHPFTAPLDECLPYLEDDARKGEVRAKAYDMVLNGIELSSGSIRITDPILQGNIFRLLGLSDEEAQEKFGYLTGAFKYGAPPHGGMALGLDRIVMQLTGSESLRDVVAYPKLQNASEPMTSCPAMVDDAQLRDIGIAVTEIEE
ncbi:MAG: aspartate--tRNA ligase [Oscillospiraceae bacterium]